MDNYEKRVRELEAKGATRSDAQSVIEAKSNLISWTHGDYALKYTKLEKKYLALKFERDRLRTALEFVVNRENLTFAECRDAEEIIAKCKEALSRGENK